MAFGKPVISTAYSSTLEFANASNSYPVPATIVEVGDDAAPYPSYSRWAEPDVTAAAEQMVRVYTDRSGGAAVAARARADIEALHGPSARGPLLRSLLDQSRRTRDAFGARDRTKTTLVAPPAGVTVEPIRSSSVGPLSADQAAPFEAEAMVPAPPQPNIPSRIQRPITQ